MLRVSHAVALCERYTRNLIFFWLLFLDQAKKSNPPEAAAVAAFYKKI